MALCKFSFSKVHFLYENLSYYYYYYYSRFIACLVFNLSTLCSFCVFLFSDIHNFLHVLSYFFNHIYIFFVRLV